MVDVSRWRARWPWLATPLAVQERFVAIGGRQLAGSIALASFVSLFPLLLVMISVIGYWSAGDSGVATSLVGHLGLHGQAAATLREAIDTAEQSRRTASVIGVAGLVWSGLGVVGAVQTACNAAWQAQGRGLIEKLVALRWLLGAGLLFLTSLALGPMLAVLPGFGVVLAVTVGLGLSIVLFTWTYTSLGGTRVGWRVNLPGAALVAVGFEGLKAAGAVFLPRTVASSSALYGSLGIVFAVLGWLILCGRLLVYGAALNVIRFEHAAGTVTAEIEVPRIEGEVPLTTTRGGAVEQAAPAEVLGPG